MNTDIIVGLGEALWDVLPEGKKLGGAPANFAYHVKQFGFNSMAVSAVGDDKLGEETLAALNSKGLDYIMAQVPYPTGTVQVTLDEDGIPTYDIRENVAWDNIPFTPELEEIARRCRAVCWGSLAQRNVVSRETIHKFLETMPDGGGRLKIFDVNLRQHFYSREVLESSLKISDSYDVETRELTVNVSGNCIVTPDNKKITVAVTHSNYSSFQKNAQNYMHDHFPILYLTAAGGDDLQVNTDGSYDMTFKGVVPVSYNNGNGTIVTGNKVTINLDELRIVAFISDSWDGADNDRYVLNSATKEAATVGASVAEVELAGVNVYGTDSRIVVEGDYDTVKVFNASGMETGTEGLSAGLYIVKVTVDGQSMVKKVAVK